MRYFSAISGIFTALKAHLAWKDENSMTQKNEFFPLQIRRAPAKGKGMPPWIPRGGTPTISVSNPFPWFTA